VEEMVADGSGDMRDLLRFKRVASEVAMRIRVDPRKVDFHVVSWCA
jgi:hypothetical protein